MFPLLVGRTMRATEQLTLPAFVMHSTKLACIVPIFEYMAKALFLAQIAFRAFPSYLLGREIIPRAAVAATVALFDVRISLRRLHRLGS